MINQNETQNDFPRGVEVVGSAIIVNQEGKILLTKSPKWSNKWIMPGGHIESGEKISEALIREAREEVGLQLEPIEVVAWGELINSKDFHRPAHFIYFDLLCKIRDIDSSIKLDGDELTDYVWIMPENALKMDLAESYQETIEKYIAFKNN